MNQVFIGLGANIGHPRQNLLAASKRLGQHFESYELSSLYETEPEGYLEQPRFQNAVARFFTNQKPLEVLLYLQSLESEFGRIRTIPNGPRSLDLDLLLYSDHVLKTQELILPHPRMHQRHFVLRPLLDLEPKLEIPGIGPASLLLEQLKSKRSHTV